jgi:hypothetical protein
LTTFILAGRRLGSLFVLVGLLVVALVLPQMPEAAGSSTSSTQVIEVDPTHKHANDSNPGTARRPLRTLGRALELAKGFNAQSVPVRVDIHPSIYREELTLFKDQSSTTTPMGLRGVGAGVVVSGSDVWDGWDGGADGLYTHRWPYKWGPAEIPQSWPEETRQHLEDHPVILRREMIFVDRVPLLQVMSASEMRATQNSFYVSEDTAKVFIHVAPEVKIEKARVEVAVRPLLLQVESRHNLSIRNLTFRDAATPTLRGGAALVIRGSENVRVINSRFMRNNASGLNIPDNTNVKLRGVRANNNGISGFTAVGIHGFQVIDSEASYNNWRGSRGWERGSHSRAVDPFFIDWATGQKLFDLSDATFRGYRAIRNLTGGLWFDTKSRDVTIEDAVLKGNLTHGVFVEANPGPFSIKDSKICGNETGVLGSNSADVRVTKSVLADNLLGQIFLAGAGGPRAIYEGGKRSFVQSENWVVRGNRIAVDDGQLALGTYLSGDLWSAYIETLDSGDNSYSSPTVREVFELPGQGNVTLEKWKEETGTDAGSTFSLTRLGCGLPTDQAKLLSPPPPDEPPAGNVGWAVAAASLLLGAFFVLRKEWSKRSFEKVEEAIRMKAQRGEG